MSHTLTNDIGRILFDKAKFHSSKFISKPFRSFPGNFPCSIFNMTITVCIRPKDIQSQTQPKDALKIINVVNFATGLEHLLPNACNIIRYLFKEFRCRFRQPFIKFACKSVRRLLSPNITKLAKWTSFVNASSLFISTNTCQLPTKLTFFGEWCITPF